MKKKLWIGASVALVLMLAWQMGALEFLDQGSLQGGGEVEVKASSASFSNTDDITVENDRLFMLSTDHANYDTDDDIVLNMSVNKIAPGEVVVPISVKAEEFRNENNSSDSNVYTLVTRDSDSQVECYVTQDKTATSSDSQGSGYVSIGDDSASAVASVYCNANGVLDKLDTYSSRMVRTTIGDQNVDLQIMRTG